MTFSSLEFLCWFLPFFLMIYYILPRRMRNGCILLFSVIFYGYGCQEHPEYLLLILLSVAVNYLLGIAVISFPFKKSFLIGGLLFNFGILFVFKYLNFFLRILKLPPVNLLLPIGISFYTFQIVSYLVDVYRGTVEAERNMVNLGTYILLFPQLIAGPIVRYSKPDQDFYWDENGDLVIVFGKYEVGPGSMGCPAFVIPQELYQSSLS